MVQVPFATTNISKTLLWAKTAIESIGLESIHSIQIKNEPNAYSDTVAGTDDVYLGPPAWQGTFTNETYVPNFTRYAIAIRAELNLPTYFFTAFNIGQEVSDPSESAWLFDVETIFHLGIDNNSTSMQEVTHHYYQNNAGTAADLATGLMNITTTHANLDYFRDHINYLKINHPSIPYVLNEIGNSFDSTNSYAYQARLGSALWAVDLYLYALSIGVSRFNYQQTMHAGFNLWLPVPSGDLQAQVFANYYSQPFLADFIGDSGQTMVAKVNIDGSSSGPSGDAYLAAYVAFDQEVAKRGDCEFGLLE
ncbi:uncharacterized protein N7483_011847 [Penicillium malachiteum]|uniref:uncharacterized protein n=1 Tax=Penicillium malachiteum TaxID=1324776 RepID=UPI0025491ECE|nr:uncharacterized protein N7483_011847 [Penicillium malachiteum]KAJ5714666.1 hypothetical protein N7483_011847 [Penicillium malachiteum]